MTIENEDLTRYQELLGQIGRRLEAARHALSQPDEYELSFAALHLRVVLELVVLGSLVTNRSAIASVSAAFATKDADGARKLARKVNPDFWPTAIIRRRLDNGEFTMDDRAPAEFLQESEWGRAYGDASSALHAANPYQPVTAEQRERLRVSVTTWLDKATSLLTEHRVTLVDRDYMILAWINTETRQMQASLFERMPDS